MPVAESGKPIISESNDDDDEIELDVMHHSDVFENTIIINSMVKNLFGIINVNPVGVPKNLNEIPQVTNSFYGKFIRICSQQLADKAFLKNDIGQNNLDLINQKILHK